MPIINVNDVVYLIMSRLVIQITVSTSIESYCKLPDWARQTNVADVACLSLLLFYHNFH